MTDPIQRFLRSTRITSTSNTEKKAALDVLNHTFGTNFNADELFETLHQTILGMFIDYGIFGGDMQDLTSVVSAHKWINAAQYVERFIVENKYPKEFAESPMRRGLIQVYLYFFATHYLNRPKYTYKYIQRHFLNLKNLNTLQFNRELVFAEMLARIKVLLKTQKWEHASVELIIPREKITSQLSNELQENPYLLIIGPQGMGKTVTLNLMAELKRSECHIHRYQFSLRDQISHPDFFTDQMLTFFVREEFNGSKSDRCLYLLDDMHLLPPSLQYVFRNTILPEVLKLKGQTQTKVIIIAASAFPLDILINYHSGSPRFIPRHLGEFDAGEVEALCHQSPVRSSHTPQEIYEATRGYPALVSQMVTSGVTFDNSLWFNTIFSSINWDEPVTALMKALCTFRYIGPFFMNDLAKFVSDPYLMQEVWHISETISDHTQARLLWEKLINKNAFIHRVSLDQQEFPLDKNFKIDRVLRQLAENAVCADQPALFDQRHKIAADYYYAQIINPLIPGHKKPLLIIEYLYHLVKQGISDIQILQIAEQLQSLARSKETQADVELSNALFRKHFCYDQELKEIMNEDLFNSIIAVTHKEGAA